MSELLKAREILLGVSGGIAAYKAADLCSRLVQRGSAVTVVMTESAHRFIGATTFEALTGRPVYSDPFVPHENFRGAHIGLPERAELIVIAPATAQSLARLALGLADDLLSLTVMAASVPVIVAPAMNSTMWEQPAVQRNVQQLIEDGVHIVAPGEGWLSCGRSGPGRMADVETVMETILQVVGRPDAATH